jgi:hypothetical protein
MLRVGMPSWTLRVLLDCETALGARLWKTTQSVGDGIPTQSVGTSSY